MMLIVSIERKGDIMRQDVLNEINIFLRGGEKETMSKAAMARIMGCDPRTVKRYLEGYELKKKRNRTVLRLYKNVYRLKKAFPAINTKEITEVLNKKIEFRKKGKKARTKTKNKKCGYHYFILCRINCRHCFLYDL